MNGYRARLCLNCTLALMAVVPTAAAAGSVIQEQLACVESVRVSLSLSGLTGDGVLLEDLSVVERDLQDLIVSKLVESGLSVGNDVFPLLAVSVTSLPSSADPSMLGVVALLELIEPLARESEPNRAIEATIWSSWEGDVVSLAEAESSLERSVSALTSEFAAKAKQARKHARRENGDRVCSAGASR